jgi:iron(III) transport system ATP-binding protein
VTGLKLAGVSHAFGGKPVLHDIDLDVPEGAVACLLGPSGCGKSTLLRLAAGLEELQAGAIEILGETVAVAGGGQPPEARRVGLMFQDFALFPHLDVKANVEFGLIGLDAGAKRQRSMEMLERVGMAHAADSYPHTLSGGEQQRVALARALAPRPRVMLLDEPFSSLDTHLRDRVRTDCLAVLRESGTTTLVVTHEPEEAMMVADRIVVMRAGRIVQQGTPEQLYHHPLNAFCASLFGEINEMDGVVERGDVKTALGSLAAGDWPDGAALRVLVRPESVRVGSGPAEARVLESRCVGSAVLTRLAVENGAGTPPIEVAARIAGLDAPAAGSRVRVGLDPTMAFVFPPSDR